LADVAKFGLVDGDILFNNTNSPELVGKTALFTGAQERFVFSNHFTRLRVNRKRVDPRYVARWLAKERNRGVFSRLCNQWVNQASVRKEALLALEVPLPETLEEQRRIADILDKADAIRRKRKEAIALTEKLLRSAFLEMFGDPVTNPKRWPVKPLGELLAFLTSGSRGWAQHYANSGETFLRIQNVRKDLLDLSDVAFVQAPDSAEARRTETKPGDVLLSITADLGRTAVVPASLPRAFINQHLAILRPQGINAEYLSAFLASEGGELQINQRNKGGVKAGLNFDDIRSVEVLLPPVAAQEKFATAKRRIRATSADIERALLHDDDLFNSLVARAFSGELSS
jgi:type I restriction enzyme S subunit